MSRSDSVVNTTSGKLQGQNENGVYVFRGIPYAAAPVGKLRWRPPEPVKPWKGVRSVERFGATAPQLVSPQSAAFAEGTETPDEDCLFLNVWTPGLDNLRRPAMVWIHGGAFIRGSGSSPNHERATLVRKGNVVVVSINYRLGALGFLNLKEATHGVIPATGNEGLLDQIAALKWVRDNIAAFGGDPSNVTLFGESAGGMSIGCLMAMPSAKGLFQKGILQSGASTFRPIDQATRVGEKFMEKLGIKLGESERLLSLSAQELVSLPLTLQEVGYAGSSVMHGTIMEPVVDGEVLPEIPLDAIQKGSAKDIIVLTGSNLEEQKFFGAASPALKRLDEAGLLKRVARQLPLEYGKPLIEQYRAIRESKAMDARPGEILMAIQTDQQFRIPAVRLAEVQSRLGVKTWNYLFTWESCIPGMGACHGLDVGFVFDALVEDFHGVGPDAERLVTQMQDAWLAFARTGDPSCESLGKWPPYGNERNTMLLGMESYIQAAPYEEERRIWDGVPNDCLG